MNNGDPKYDIFINYELINSFYQYSTFEIIPFLNSTIIRNRIQNREIYYSLLFGLYALSEIFRPYGDYNLGLKYKEISRKFIKLILDNKQTGSIQLIETLYILSLIGMFIIIKFIYYYYNNDNNNRNSNDYYYYYYYHYCYCCYYCNYYYYYFFFYVLFFILFYFYFIII